MTEEIERSEVSLVSQSLTLRIVKKTGSEGIETKNVCVCSTVLRSCTPLPFYCSTPQHSTPQHYYSRTPLTSNL